MPETSSTAAGPHAVAEQMAARGKLRKAEQADDTAQRLRRKDDDEFSRLARLTWAKLTWEPGTPAAEAASQQLGQAEVAQHYSSDPIPALPGKMVSYTARSRPIGKP